MKLCLFSLRKNGGALSDVPVTLITNSEPLPRHETDFFETHFDIANYIDDIADALPEKEINFDLYEDEMRDEERFLSALQVRAAAADDTEDFVSQVVAFAFGLAAADGVSRWLEERGTGLDAWGTTIPIVTGAILFDLGIGDSSIRPGADCGYAAAGAAAGGAVQQGSVGAGAELDRGCRGPGAESYGRGMRPGTGLGSVGGAWKRGGRQVDGLPRPDRRQSSGRQIARRGGRH